MIRSVFREWKKVKYARAGLMAAFLLNCLAAVISPVVYDVIAEIFSVANKVHVLLPFVVFLVVMQNAADTAAAYIRGLASNRCSTVLYNLYYEKVIRADYNMYTKYTLPYITRASEYINKIVRTGESFMDALLNIVRVGANITAIFLVGGPGIFIPVLCLYAAGSLVLRKLFQKYIVIDRKSNKLVEACRQESGDVVEGFQEVRSFHTQEKHVESIQRTNAGLEKLSVKRFRILAGFNISISVIDGSGVLLVILYVLHKLLSGQLDPVTGMQLTAYIMSVTMPLVSMMNFFYYISQDSSLRQDYENIVRYENITDFHGTKELSELKSGIEIKHVSFAYKDTGENEKQEDTLKDVFMLIPCGSHIGICGPSGSGKSTLFKLLSRFFIPDEGTIAVDGIPLQDLSDEAYRRLFGMVFQDNFIFPGTIMENVKYGSPEASDAEAEEACEKADILSFIQSLPDGFASDVGPSGIKLSGGQKQRIALARLFLKNPAVVLLDEATSSLDGQSENVIEASVKNLSGRTVITIAHRLSTIEQCDMIYVMEAGKIVQQGTHKELLSTSGLYRDMWTAKKKDTL